MRALEMESSELLSAGQTKTDLLRVFKELGYGIG